MVKIDGVFQFDDLCSGESDCCTASRDSKDKMVEVCSIELEHALGTSKYKEVLDYYKNNLLTTKVEEDTINAGR